MSRSRLRNKWMHKQHAKSNEAPKNKPSKYITTHCSAEVSWLQEPGSFGGHRIPKGGHRRVSGLVRAKVKEEVRKQIMNNNYL